MTTDPRIVELLHLLESGTDLGELPWSPGGRDGVFDLILDNGRIKILRDEELYPSEYALMLVNKDNQVIEEFEPASEEERELLREVYAKARHSALESTITGLLAELKSKVGHPG